MNKHIKAIGVVMTCILVMVLSLVAGSLSPISRWALFGVFFVEFLGSCCVVCLTWEMLEGDKETKG